MTIIEIQLLAILFHCIGDYITQSHWMAINKTKSSFAAWIHASVYSIPFSAILPISWLQLFIIFFSHFLIDRFRLARYLCLWKNVIGDIDIYKQDHGLTKATFKKYNTPTGYPADTPPFLSVWLLILCDNILHISINAFSIAYL